MRRIAQGLSRSRLFQAHRCCDVAGKHFLDFLALIGVHLQDAAKALLAALDRVENRVARLDRAGIDPEESQLADVRIGHDLERQGSKRIGIIRGAMALGFILENAIDRRNVGRSRQIFDHGVQHGLHALVLEGGAAKHRYDLGTERTGTQTGLYFGLGQFAGLKVLVHQFLVGLGSRLDHLFPPLLGFGLKFRGNIAVFELDALAGLVPDYGLHLDQIHHALEFLFGANWNLQRNGVGLEAQAHLVVDFEEVCALTVHLVHERQTRYAIAIGLAPYRFGLRLYAADSAIDHACAVKHAHRTLDFNCEIDVSRCVDDINAMLGEILAHAFPEACGRRRCNGDTTFLFLLHPVHGGRAVMNFANLVIDAGIKQNTLGGSGLSGVDMRRNSDIAIAVDGSLAGHLIYLPYLNQTAMTPCFTKRQGGGRKRNSRRRPGKTRCYLETEMRECLVGFRHTVDFFALFHRRTAPLGRLE